VDIEMKEEITYSCLMVFLVLLGLYSTMDVNPGSALSIFLVFAICFSYLVANTYHKGIPEPSTGAVNYFAINFELLMVIFAIIAFGCLKFFILI
jgi:hypothetical protein